MSVLGPAVVPSLQLPTVAIPDAFVVVEPPVMLPPPVPTANVTATPAIGLSPASVTFTDGAVGSVAPAAADWLSPALTTIFEGGPGTTVS